MEDLQPGDRLLYFGGKSFWTNALVWGMWGKEKFKKNLYTHEVVFLGTKKHVKEVLKKNKKLFTLNHIKEISIEFKSINGSYLFIESDWRKKRGRSGVHFISEIELLNRSGFHDVFRCSNDFEFFEDFFYISALNLISERIKYDFLGLFWQAVLFGKRKINKKWSKKKTQLIAVHSINRMYCTELGQFLENVSHHFWKEHIPSVTNPRNVSEIKYLRNLGTLTIA